MLSSSYLWWCKLSDSMNQTFRRQRALNTSGSTDAPGCPFPRRQIHGQALLSGAMNFFLAKRLLFFPQPLTLFFSSHNKSKDAALQCENSVTRDSSFMRFSKQFKNACKVGATVSNYGQIREAKHKDDQHQCGTE